MKQATTIDEQIALLRSRGMRIDDEHKAKEALLDIGYYRLGFYWFPLECGYPKTTKRQHFFKDGATLDWAISLFNADFNVRNIIAPFLYHIEGNLRTLIIYIVSNHYKNDPIWFASEAAMTSDFLINRLPAMYSNVKRNEVIKHHHVKYPVDSYAPAWKTLEFITFGDLMYLFDGLLDDTLKLTISKHYNLRNPKVFSSYMFAIRIMRNLCAHGHNIFDLKLPVSITSGPIRFNSLEMHQNLCGAIAVILYVLKQIPGNGYDELKNALIYELGKTNVRNIRMFEPLRQLLTENK